MTANAAATYTGLSVEACSDMANFRDMQVGLSFIATSLASGTAGADGTVADGGTLTITVDSNEATPTVSFATSSIDIDEGGTNTVAILADSELGPEVGTVMVSKSGYAMLSLWQGGDMLEANADGMYAVDLMDSANNHPDDQRRQRPRAGRRDDQHGNPHDRERQRREHRRPRLADGHGQRLHGGACAAAGRTAPARPIPDGRRRAALSSAPGLGKLYRPV